MMRNRILAGVVVMLGAVGVFAVNGWFPGTDSFTGKRTGWFGREVAKGAESSWNPFAAEPPTPTPQLSKEYIYAGSRLLAVEDANANAAPPADLAIWRPSDGTWWVLSGASHTTQQWGMAGDEPVPGDYDGDGKTDFCVFRSSNATWYIINSSTGSAAYAFFGQSGDKPYTADFDGDGRSDVAVYRGNTPTNGLGTWYILNSNGSGMSTVQFGLNADKPAAADFDGDGRADINVWRDSNYTFYTLYSSTNAFNSMIMGSSAGSPVPSDYDGDGKANFAIKSGNAWSIFTNSPNAITGSGGSGSGGSGSGGSGSGGSGSGGSGSGGSGTSAAITVTWGTSSDIAVQNDYDGDGKTDIASWRPSNGTWYIRQSSKLGVSGQSPTTAIPHPNETRQTQWGMNGDFPTPAFYRR